MLEMQYSTTKTQNSSFDLILKRFEIQESLTVVALGTGALSLSAFAPSLGGL